MNARTNAQFKYVLTIYYVYYLLLFKNAIIFASKSAIPVLRPKKCKHIVVGGDKQTNIYFC